jgi:mannose-1-phosphate guanylyltransferase
VSGTAAARNPHAGLLEPAGIYVFSAEALREVGTTGYQDIKERLIPRLYRAGRRIEPFAVGRDAAPRVTGAESYLALSHSAIERIAAENPPPRGYRRVGDSLVHETASVAPTASLVGPVIVGPSADIRATSMLVGPTSVGEGCVVGRGAVISRSTLWRDCSIADGAIVDRCVVVDHTSLEGETAARDAVLMPSAPAFGSPDGERFSRRMRPSRRRGTARALKLDV